MCQQMVALLSEIILPFFLQFLFFRSFCSLGYPKHLDRFVLSLLVIAINLFAGYSSVKNTF